MKTVSISIPPAQAAQRFRRNRRKALLFTGLLTFAGAGLGLAAYPEAPVVGGLMGAGGCFVAAVALISMADWRHGLAMLFFLLLAEDSIRKALPGMPGWVNLGKDLVVVGCYASYFLGFGTYHRRKLPTYGRWLVALPMSLWATFVVVEVFNPELTHILIGVSGVRTWILYMPMVLLTADAFRDPDEAEGALRWAAVLAIPFLGLTIMQNTFSEMLPSFLRDSVFIDARSLEGGGWISYNESFFASPTLYALVCVFQLCLVVGLLKTYQKPIWTVLLWLSGYSAIAGAYLSGVRTGLLFASVAVIGLIPLMAFRRQRDRNGGLVRRRGLLAGGLVGLMIGALLVSTLKENRSKAFWLSFDIGIATDRLSFAIDETDSQGGGLFGMGTGTAGKSGQVLALLDEDPDLHGTDAEYAEWGTVVIKHTFGDFGVYFGTILLAWLLFGLLYMAATWREGRFAPLRYSLWVYVSAQMAWFLFKAYPVLENGTMTFLFWAAVGLVVGLRRIDREEISGVFER